jgi:hypothetical protein
MIKKILKPDSTAHTYKPSTQEAEARELRAKVETPISKIKF